MVLDESAIVAKFGVTPESIPDYLALVGDSADGFPGIPGWGKKAAAAALSIYGQLENIPKDWKSWAPSIRSSRSLAESLFGHWQDAMLFRKLATLRTDVPVFNSIDELRWNGKRANFEDFYSGRQILK
jgi:5'-3' exonuclease